MERIDVAWLSRRAVIIAAILFLGLSIAAFVQTVSLPVFFPDLLKVIMADTIRFTGIVTALLYAIKEGTS